MTEKTVTAQPTFSWLASWRVYLQPASLRMLLLGFAAGLPLLLVLGTLSFRLREAGIDRSTIGYLSWVGLAYGFKWVWAPLVDRMPIPFLTHRLGRRRSWLLFAQMEVGSEFDWQQAIECLVHAGWQDCVLHRHLGPTATERR